jgi:hypothetical protein
MVEGGVELAGVVRALWTLAAIEGWRGFGAGVERPSTLSPMRLSLAWIGLMVSMIRLNSWATSEGGFAGDGEGSGVGVRARAPESGSLKEETATTASESSSMALSAQWMDELELLSFESKLMGRGGRSLDSSSAQSMQVASARGVRSSSPAAGQGEGSGWDGSAGLLSTEDSSNRAMIATDSAAEGSLTTAEVAFGAVVDLEGSARLGGIPTTGCESSSRPA